MAIKLEVGKYYKNREGKVYGPIQQQEPCNDFFTFYFQKDNNDHPIWWAVNGRFSQNGFESEEDLIEEVPKPLKLEPGKYYKNKRGEVIGPIEALNNENEYCYKCDTLSYRKDGIWSDAHPDNPFDLVEEVPPPLTLQIGKYYKLRNEEVVGPLNKKNKECDYPFYIENIGSWTREGKWAAGISKAALDLIEEVEPPVESYKEVFERSEHKAMEKTTTSNHETPKSDKLSPGIEQVPFCAIERIGAIFAEGEQKYGLDNWKKDPGNVEYNKERLRHALRHLHLYAEGDTSEDHLAKVAWFCVTTMWRGNNAQT